MAGRVVSSMNVKAFAALLLLAPALAGCFGNGVSFTVSAPAWQSGYGFVHNISVDVSFEADLGEGDGPVRESETFGPVRLAHEVLSTTLEHKGERYYLLAGELHGFLGPPPTQTRLPPALGPFPFLQVTRQRDLMTAPAGLDPLGTAYRIGEIPPGTYLDFPLTPGKTWRIESATTDLGGEDDPILSQIGFIVTARVGGYRDVQTAHGITRSIVVDFLYEAVGLEEAKAAIRAFLTSQGADVDRVEFEMEADHQVVYSPDLQVEVLTEQSVRVFLEVVATMKTGEKIDQSVEAKLDLVMELIEGIYTPKAERTVEEVRDLVTGRTGVTGGPAYSVAVNATPAFVNAAQPEDVRFTTSLAGIDELPPGTSAYWRIFSPTGKTAAQGDGLAFQHRFDEAGLFTIEVGTEDAHGTITATRAPFAANYRTTIAKTCAQVAVEPHAPGCGPQAVPVRPGITSLVVSATPKPAASQLPHDVKLVLKDPTGKEQVSSQPDGSGTYTIGLKGFDGSTIDARDWSMQLVQSLAVREDATYAIDLSYVPDDAVPPAEETPPSPAVRLQWATDAARLEWDPGFVPRLVPSTFAR